MKSRMNVYLTTAKRAYKYAYPVIQSLFENNKESEVYLYLVSENLEYDDISDEIKLAGEYGDHIIILPFDEEKAKETIVIEDAEHWPMGTLGCYWMFHELLPSDVNRIMAIESDAIVLGSLREFYDTDFEGNYAICPDPEHKPETHRELMKKLDGDLLTFVVSLYDVNAIKRDFSIEQILEADRKGAGELGHSQQELTFGILFKNRIKYIPAPSICVEENSNSLKRFGLQYLVDCEKTEKIIHFSSTGVKEKPWNTAYFMPGYKKWWDYAEKSPYFDYYIEQQRLFRDSAVDYIKMIRRKLINRNRLIIVLGIVFLVLCAVVIFL